MLIRTSASRSTLVKAKLVNWPPSALKISGLQCSKTRCMLVRRR
jgi:hypothetical protein